MFGYACWFLVWEPGVYVFVVFGLVFLVVGLTCGLCWFVSGFWACLFAAFRLWL